MPRLPSARSYYAPGARVLDALRQLLDPALGAVEPFAAERGRARSPRSQSAIASSSASLPALEPLDDLLQLALRLLERELAHRVSSTRAPNPPSASSTSTRAPGSSVVADERRRRRRARSRSRGRASSVGESARRRRGRVLERGALALEREQPGARRETARASASRRSALALERAPGAALERGRATRSSRASSSAQIGHDEPRRRPSASRRARRRRGRRAACPARGRPRETTGTGQAATARTSRSSLNGSRSSKLPPPRASTTTSTLGSAQSSLRARRPSPPRRAVPARTSRRRATCAGGKRVVDVGQHVALGRRVVAGHEPDPARQARAAGACAASANSPSPASLRFSRSSAREVVAERRSARS